MTPLTTPTDSIIATGDTTTIFNTDGYTATDDTITKSDTDDTIAASDTNIPKTSNANKSINVFSFI